MKNPPFAPFLVICLLLILIQGCKKPCKDITCVNGACVEGTCLCNDGWTGPNCDQVDECHARNCNNGYCTDGACVCDALWEGNNCSSPINQKFVGNWSVTETCSASGQQGYSIVITAHPYKLDEIRITNLNNGGFVEATIESDKLSFTIGKQYLTFGYDVASTSAAIAADGDRISIAYTLYEQTPPHAVIETCTADWIKY